MKLRRQSKIIEYIENLEIETQEELTEKLNLEGFNTTQATVSRDIKELRLVKVMSKNGTQKYATDTSSSAGNFSARLKSIFKDSVIKVDTAQNIVVIKTLPGLGSAAAASVDSLGNDEIVGSLAGDDTVFVAIKTSELAEKFAEKIKEML